MTDETASVQGEDARERCPRDSDWCDGVICRERGIDCPNADPMPVPAPSDEAVEAAVRVLLDADLWMRARLDDFPVTEDPAEEIAQDILAAIDLPRLLAEARAEGEAARTAEIVAWLRSDVVARMAWQFHGEAALADAIAKRFSVHG